MRATHRDPRQASTSPRSQVIPRLRVQTLHSGGAGLPSHPQQFPGDSQSGGPPATPKPPGTRPSCTIMTRGGDTVRLEGNGGGSSPPVSAPLSASPCPGSSSVEQQAAGVRTPAFQSSSRSPQGTPSALPKGSHPHLRSPITGPQCFSFLFLFFRWKGGTREF